MKQSKPRDKRRDNQRSPPPDFSGSNKLRLKSRNQNFLEPQHHFETTRENHYKDDKYYELRERLDYEAKDNAYATISQALC